MNSSQRIAKRIAASGLCSRREAERWIDSGRITLNGQPVTTPATLVTESDTIIVDDTPLPNQNVNAAPKLYAYHKPTGELVTESDPQGRKTIYDSLPKTETRLIPIGRLDLNSEGLLLLTTAPTLATEMMRSNLPRTYRVRTFGQISLAQEQEMMRGITFEGIKYAPCKIKLEKASGRNVWYILTLHEGKNREIRNLFRYFDIQVNRLIRIQFGDIKLGDLKAAQLKEIPIQKI